MFGNERGANGVDGKIFGHPIGINFANRAFWALPLARQEASRDENKRWRPCVCGPLHTGGNAGLIRQLKIPGLAGKAKYRAIAPRRRSVGKRRSNAA
jgi:hypothetical protein